MSDFFDRLAAAAKRAADSVSTEVSVAAEEQKVKEAYQALGKLYYNAVRTGTDLTGADFADQCRRIEASIRRIKELKDRKDVTGTYADDEDFVDVD